MKKTFNGATLNSHTKPWQHLRASVKEKDFSEEELASAESIKKVCLIIYIQYPRVNNVQS